MRGGAVQTTLSPRVGGWSRPAGHCAHAHAARAAGAPLTVMRLMPCACCWPFTIFIKMLPPAARCTWVAGSCRLWCGQQRQHPTVSNSLFPTACSGHNHPRVLRPQGRGQMGIRRLPVALLGRLHRADAAGVDVCPPSQALNPHRHNQPHAADTRGMRPRLAVLQCLCSLLRLCAGGVAG